MRVALRFFLLVLYALLGVDAALSQGLEAYQGIPWNSPFPVVEQRFPAVTFVEENPYHVTLFSLPHPEERLKRVEFKFFENKLISVLRFYEGAIDQCINEEYIRSLVSGLGPRKDERTTTAQSLAGTAQVIIHEYENILVLFRYYPEAQPEEFVPKENSIVIVYKPTFDQMLHFRKYGQADTESVVDYDYIEF